MSLSLRKLRYFRVIVEEGSVTAAGHRLGIAQPALSQTVRQLEEHFGTVLLERDRKGVQPTAEGLRVLAGANDVLNRLSALDEELRGHTTEAHGDVTVALAVTMARQITPRLLLRMSSGYPGVNVRIVVVASTDAIGLMENRVINLALIPMPELTAKFECRPVYRERVCLTQLSTNNRQDTTPIQLAELSNVPLVQSSTRYDLRRRLELSARERGVKLNTCYEQDTSDAMLSIVLAGLAALPTQVSIYHPTLERPLLDIRPIIEPEIIRKQVLLRLATQTPTLAQCVLERELISTIAELTGEAALPGEMINDGEWFRGAV